MKKEYYFENGEFVIENYDKQRVFTSFLPAIAGKNGIPLWTFFVNRGQGMSSFGVKDKNGAILEFFPAYTAYQVISRIGFRTFIRAKNKAYEFFTDNGCKNLRKMRIKREQFSIEEENRTLGIKVKVTYFTLPNENVPALIRKVEIENLLNQKNEFELIDGLSQIFTPLTDHGQFKVMSNLLRSWMEVVGLDENVAYYKLRASTSDSAEVKNVSEGNFYVSFMDEKIIRPIVDPTLIFGCDNSFARPLQFEQTGLDTILSMPSYCYNKVPCGFSAVKVSLEAQSTKKLYTVIGQMYSYDAFLSIKDQFISSAYIEKMQEENTSLINQMTKDVKTNSSNLLFNEYIESTYLDNMLRGGYPFNFKDQNGNNHIYYLFSRKHGDPERDYNWFNIQNEFYSQGNGNFRDICQNRRNDSQIHKEVKDYNLKYFMNLIQLDGYNPLAVNGATFSLNSNVNPEEIVAKYFKDKNNIMTQLLSERFTPGSIVNTLMKNSIEANVSEEEYLAGILTLSHENIEANFGEGYWLDHFTYLLDLYESFDAIYPDLRKQAMFDDYSYRFFESPCLVQPRSAKYVLTNQNVVRQYGALYEHDELKCTQFSIHPGKTNWARNRLGEYVTTNLYSKFFMLAFLKFNLLDNAGIGIEMEGGKPGWNDACNGLPGLFGSGVSETFETMRIVRMLLNVGKKNECEQISVPNDFLKFFKSNMKLLSQGLSDFEYWDRASTLREEYREGLRLGAEENVVLSVKDILSYLRKLERKLQQAMDKAKEIGNGIYPTFITYEATKYEIIKDKDGQEKVGYNFYPLVKVLEFKRNEVAKFLEGPARAYKVISDKKELKDQYQAVKESGIYDKELKMYKTSENLDGQSFELGRIVAFTKGWLERESNFMHMTYKYLYGLIKSGLYKEFFVESKTNMVCNLNPKSYGRSPLEHCSFIASSVNPDKNTHGQGFVSRLSGSTAEMLSIYLTMMTGGQPFIYENQSLKLNFKPIIDRSYFNEDGTFSFTFLGNTKVTYVNLKKKNTYQGKVVSYTLIHDGIKETMKEVIDEKAILVRDGGCEELIVEID